jgi:hypothetical protein
MIENQVLRGFIANIEVLPPLIVTFEYNPESINDNKTVSYEDRNGNLCGNWPGKVYTGGGHRTISFDIKLHGLEKGKNALNPTALDNGISTELAKLRSFMYPMDDAWGTLGGLLGGEENGRRLTAPPDCIFGFGTKILQCIVTEITINETQFNSFLAPVRADVGITLIVNEDSDNALYEIDKQHRNLLAALGIQNIRIF